jgi:Lrp/AsnC family transcriptional regulator, leucine-responsive regulatory protein
MVELDSVNCVILNLLQKDSRMSLTKIAKHVGLSVDSVKKRIAKLLLHEVYYPKIQLRPRTLGYKNIVDVRIKLHNHTAKDVENFINYLVKHPNVAEVFAISGNWNFSIVIIAKDYADQGMISSEIRNHFSRIINEWVESLTTSVYKFEDYDLVKLINPKPINPKPINPKKDSKKVARKKI